MIQYGKCHLFFGNSIAKNQYFGLVFFKHKYLNEIENTKKYSKASLVSYPYKR